MKLWANKEFRAEWVSRGLVGYMPSLGPSLARLWQHPHIHLFLIERFKEFISWRKGVWLQLTLSNQIVWFRKLGKAPCHITMWGTLQAKRVKRGMLGCYITLSVTEMDKAFLQLRHVLLNVVEKIYQRRFRHFLAESPEQPVDNLILCINGKYREEGKPEFHVVPLASPLFLSLISQGLWC